MQNSRYQKTEKFYEIPVFVAVVLLIPVIIIEYRNTELKEFANSGPKKVVDFYSAIKTMGVKLNGRINSEVILLRAVR